MIGLLHTTESDVGSGLAVHKFFLRNPGSQPHVLLDPSNGISWTYLPASSTAKALANLPGGVETNRRPGGVFQVEIVARAKDVGTYSDGWYAQLKHHLTQWSTIHGIAYVFHPDHTRLTPAQWTNVNLQGWFGHCHVPENSHWDPGTLDYSRLQIQSLTVESLTNQIMALEPTTPVTVSGTQYAVVDVLGWILEGVNALRSAAPAGAAGFTPQEFADELAKRLQS